MTEPAVEHFINWRFDRFMAQVVPELVCTSSAHALCRSKPDPASGCSCEEYFGITRDEQGWFHVVYADEISYEVHAVHRHVPADECNIELYLNEDPTETILETCKATARDFPVGTTKVDLTWSGDEWEWEPADDHG